MRILIAGAGGQLGRSLQRTIANHTVTALWHGELDIVEIESVRRAMRSCAPEMVINASAYNDVDGAESNRELADAINCQGPRILASETAAVGIPLVHVSTDYVFDGQATRPYTENDPPNPLSAYASSKRAGELAVMKTNPRHFVVRTAWVFEASGKNFLNAMRRAADNPEVRVVADQFGSPTYAPHLARSIARLAGSEAYGLYHMAGQGGTSRFDLVRHLYALLGKATSIIPVQQDDFPAAAVRPRYTVLATVRGSDYQLPIWQDGVRAFVDDLRDAGLIDDTAGAAPTLDHAVIKKLQDQGGNELVAEIIGVYLADLTRLIGQITSAAKVRDETKLRSGAHALAGCSGGIGAKRLWRLCQELDRAAAANEPTRVDNLVARVESEASHVRHELLRKNVRS